MIIAGCGYTGLRLARSQQQAFGIVASEEGVQRLEQHRIDGARWDLDAQQAPPTLPPNRALVYLIPPPRQGDDDSRLAHLLDALPTPPTRLIYASTTGVYGNRNGALVHESDAPAPDSERAKRRLAAETRVREWASANDLPWVILRIPGIYGPGRLQLATVQGSRPMLRREEAGPGNRIHVDDLVAVIRAATTTPHVNEIYNVGDGDTMTNTEFVGLIAGQLGLPAPPATTRAALKKLVTARAWSFLRESREVDTRKMRDVLGVAPQFRDPREGIAASLNEMAKSG
ncbi:MAG: NAD-dependent epimerase/dehydratase family protein [Gammaproteobacteria bacterium]